MTKTNELIERQIAAWHAQHRAASRQPSDNRKRTAPDVITLSNERGAGGRDIAQRLGTTLGIPVFDREIVEHIATHKHVRVSTVETLDQHALGRIDDYLMNLFRDWSFDQHDYAQALVHTLLLLWHHGPATIVGRGAVHVVPREHALAVRVVANRDQRVRRIQQLEGVSAEEAAAQIATTDADRDAFSRHYFGVPIDDATTYDLVINTSYLPAEAAASLVAHAYRLKFRGRAGLAGRSLGDAA